MSRLVRKSDTRSTSSDTFKEGMVGSTDNNQTTIRRTFPGVRSTIRDSAAPTSYDGGSEGHHKMTSFLSEIKSEHFAVPVSIAACNDARRIAEGSSVEDESGTPIGHRDSSSAFHSSAATVAGGGSGDSNNASTSRDNKASSAATAGDDAHANDNDVALFMVRQRSGVAADAADVRSYTNELQKEAEEEDVRLEARAEEALRDPTGRLRLYINHMRCTSLDAKVSRLRGLRELYCQDNTKLKRLPHALWQLGESLTIIHASRCSLETLPEELAQLRNLRRLSLAGNKLKTFLWDCGPWLLIKKEKYPLAIDASAANGARARGGGGGSSAAAAAYTSTRPNQNPHSSASSHASAFDHHLAKLFVQRGLLPPSQASSAAATTSIVGGEGGGPDGAASRSASNGGGNFSSTIATSKASLQRARQSMLASGGMGIVGGMGVQRHTKPSLAALALHRGTTAQMAGSVHQQSHSIAAPLGAPAALTIPTANAVTRVASTTSNVSSHRRAANASNHSLALHAGGGNPLFITNPHDTCALMDGVMGEWVTRARDVPTPDTKRGGGGTSHASHANSADTDVDDDDDADSVVVNRSRGVRGILNESRESHPSFFGGERSPIVGGDRHRSINSNNQKGSSIATSSVSQGGFGFGGGGRGGGGTYRDTFNDDGGPDTDSVTTTSARSAGGGDHNNPFSWLSSIKQQHPQQHNHNSGSGGGGFVGRQSAAPYAFNGQQYQNLNASSSPDALRKATNAARIKELERVVGKVNGRARRIPTTFLAFTHDAYTREEEMSDFLHKQIPDDRITTIEEISSTKHAPYKYQHEIERELKEAEAEAERLAAMSSEGAGATAGSRSGLSPRVYTSKGATLSIGKMTVRATTLRNVGGGGKGVANNSRGAEGSHHAFTSSSMMAGTTSSDITAAMNGGGGGGGGGGVARGDYDPIALNFATDRAAGLDGMATLATSTVIHYDIPALPAFADNNSSNKAGGGAAQPPNTKKSDVTSTPSPNRVNFATAEPTFETDRDVPLPPYCSSAEEVFTTLEFLDLSGNEIVYLSPTALQLVRVLIRRDAWGRRHHCLASALEPSVLLAPNPYMLSPTSFVTGTLEAELPAPDPTSPYYCGIRGGQGTDDNNAVGGVAAKGSLSSPPSPSRLLVASTGGAGALSATPCSTVASSRATSAVIIASSSSPLPPLLHLRSSPQSPFSASLRSGLLTSDLAKLIFTPNQQHMRILRQFLPPRIDQCIMCGSEAFVGGPNIYVHFVNATVPSAATAFAIQAKETQGIGGIDPAGFRGARSTFDGDSSGAGGNRRPSPFYNSSSSPLGNNRRRSSRVSFSAARAGSIALGGLLDGDGVAGDDEGDGEGGDGFDGGSGGGRIVMTTMRIPCFYPCCASSDCHMELNRKLSRGIDPGHRALEV